MADSRVVSTVSGTVTRISTNFSGGLQLAETGSQWHNGSKFADGILRAISRLDEGDVVTLGLDDKGFIREVSMGRSASVDTTGMDDDTAKLVRKATARKAAAVAVGLTPEVTVREPNEVEARIARTSSLKLGLEAALAEATSEAKFPEREALVTAATSYAELFRPYIEGGTV